MRKTKYSDDVVNRIHNLQEEWAKVEKICREQGIGSGTLCAWQKTGSGMESSGDRFVEGQEQEKYNE